MFPLTVLGGQERYLTSFSCRAETFGKEKRERGVIVRVLNTNSECGDYVVEVK